MEIKRDLYLQKLIDHRHNGLIKVITGMRRCGKSYLLFRLFKSYLIRQNRDETHIIEMAFDDYANKQYRNPDAFYAYVKEAIKDKQPYYLLLDEVQLLGEFEDVLNGLLHIENVDIYVTGSNAKFLSKDIITEFRGRGDQIHIYPLCFSEFMSVYDGAKEDALASFLNYGGLPLVVLQARDEDKLFLLKNLLKETYLTDILNRNKVRNNAELEDLLNILASNIGGLTNPQKLSNTFNTVKKISVSPATLKAYIEYFADSFLIETANRYDVKGRKYIGTPMKYYFTDLGLRNAQLDFRQQELTHLMENAIYNELRYRGYNVDIGVVLVNGKDGNGVSVRRQLEVDFVCNKGSKRCYIQSAYSLPTQEKMTQETDSLLRLGDSFQKFVITGDRILKYQNENGVTFMNIFDFMLNENSLTV